MPLLQLDESGGTLRASLTDLARPGQELQRYEGSRVKSSAT